jgi:hypothetical protein
MPNIDSRMTPSAIVDWAKNGGVVLTATSGAAYACGYLVIRARAHALGTDPGFSLINEAYVFAGFRFVLMLLLALLVTSPLLLLLRWLGHRLAGALAPGQICAIETIAAIFVGAATVWAYAATIGVSGVLLAPSSGWLADAALDRNDYGALVVLATAALGAVMLSWADGHLRRAGGVDPLGAVLLLTGALLLVLLPMQHGVFYADRKAWRLDQTPEGATGLVPPVWLVDRGAADRVVLYGRTPDGQARLVTLKAEKLDGVAVTGISRLGTVARERDP